MSEQEEEALWWRGREKPRLTRMQFDAMPDAQLDSWIAQNVMRFYSVGETEESLSSAIWWEGEDGWPTEFTIVNEYDEQERTPFRPSQAGNAKAERRLRGIISRRMPGGAPNLTMTGRELCWVTMQFEGFTKDETQTDTTEKK